MTLLEQILEHNTRFVAEQGRSVTKVPAKKIAIFTCMDTRLVEFLEPAMGIRRGDAQVVKNAGNTVIDPTGGVIRSLMVAVYAMHCEEIYVIGHRDCGMSELDDDLLLQNMLDRGVPQEAIATMHPSLREWLGAFHDPIGNVLSVVQTIRESPLFPKDLPVHGLIFDPHNGKLELVADLPR